MEQSKDTVRILVVDDKSDKALAIASIVSDVGDVVVANSGKDALRCLMTQNFAVILLDVNMPGMDGFETAELIRQRERTPIIFVTSFYEADAHKSRAYRLGAVDYILAPVIPEVLKAKVSVFVDLYRKTEEVKKRADERVQLMQEQVARISAEAARTAAEEGERRAEFLAQTSGLLASSLQYEENLKKVANLAVPAVADWCAICLADDENSYRIVALANKDAEKVAVAESLWNGLFPGIAEKVISRIQNGETEIVTEISERLKFALPKDEFSYKLIESFNFSSYMGVPLCARKRIFGALFLLMSGGRRHFGARDQVLAEDLASRIASAVDNAKLYAEAQQANRMKDEFLAVVSHELRTPLTPILGWSRMLISGTLDGELSAHGLKIIERNVRLQSKLIEDLLDVSRIITGKLRLSMRQFELVPLIEDCIETVRAAADAKQIRINAIFDKRPSHFAGDAERIQQVLWNLLSNAVKFTPANGEITVRLNAPDSTHIMIQVTDTGRGISTKFLPYVFERFRQADSSTTRAYGGLGIGLAIVRHLVELHGGTVMAESKGDGMGSTFTIVLPQHRLASSELAEKDNSSVANSKDDVSMARRLEGSRILIVDDEPDTRDLLVQLLERHGAQIIEAATVHEALEWIDRKQVDAILSDISMPGDDGYTLIRRVRSRSRAEGGNIPAVALTAHAREEDRQRALAEGFQLHITKPFDPTTLVSSVRALLGNGIGISHDQKNNVL